MYRARSEKLSGIRHRSRLLSVILRPAVHQHTGGIRLKGDSTPSHHAEWIACIDALREAVNYSTPTWASDDPQSRNPLPDYDNVFTDRSLARACFLWVRRGKNAARPKSPDELGCLLGYAKTAV